MIGQQVCPEVEVLL